jgi:hypothetical protein
VILVVIALSAAPARASFLSGDALDTMADWLAIVVICVVPIAAIVLFWLVHILPEKVAEKRHHPQKDAITTLCLLSLAFGGLLWPIARLWAYTRPVGYRLAYGTDKHEDYYTEMGDRAKAGELWAMRSCTSARSSMSSPRRNAATRAQGVAPRTRCARADCLDGERKRLLPETGKPMEAISRHLCILRLADLHQAEVAAVEHHIASHRSRHPHCRPDNNGAHAQCGRTLIVAVAYL